MKQNIFCYNSLYFLDFPMKLFKIIYSIFSIIMYVIFVSYFYTPIYYNLKSLVSVLQCIKCIIYVMLYFEFLWIYLF